MPPHVTYALDRSFLLPTLVSAWSLLANRQGETDILFLFTDEPGESVAVIERLGRVFPQARVRAGRCPEFGAPVPHRGRLSSATYARLILPELLDHATLYLDGDTLVRHDIGALFDAASRAAPVSAVRDPGVQRALRWRDVGSPPPNAARILTYLDASADLFDAENYVNAGVIFYNTPVIRSLGLAQRLKDVSAAGRLRRERGHLFDDQSWLNVVFAGQMGFLGAEWNAFWGNRITSKAPFPVDQRELYRRSREDPAILHFAGKRRPWRMGPAWMHPRRRPWLALYRTTLSRVLRALGPV